MKLLPVNLKHVLSKTIKPVLLKVYPKLKSFLRVFALLFAICTGLFVATLLFGSICPVKTIFGIPCPGCGMTRALIFAARGNFERAFYYHPLFPLAPFLVAGVAVYSLSKKPPVKKCAGAILLALCGVFVAVWIYRLAAGWR